MSELKRLNGGRATALAAFSVILATAALLAVTAGCESEPELASPPPRSAGVPSLEEVRTQLIRNSQRWSSLEAECTLVLRSASIQRRGGIDQLRGGKLRIQKPDRPDQVPYSMINLTVPDSASPRVQLVGDGQRYSMLIYGEQTSGQYGEPLPEHVRVPLMPDDLVDAFDWLGLFHGRGQVVRLSLLPGSYCIDSLRYVEDRRAPLVASNTLFFTLGSTQPQILRKYRPDRSLRVEIRFGQVEMVKGPENEAVSIPTRVFLLYSRGGTVARLTLHEVELNKDLPEKLFQVSP